MGDVGSTSGSERSPGEGKGNPLLYSGLENSMDRGAWWLQSIGLQSDRAHLDAHTHTRTRTLSVCIYIHVGLLWPLAILIGICQLKCWWEMLSVFPSIVLFSAGLPLTQSCWGSWLKHCLITVEKQQKLPSHGFPMLSCYLASPLLLLIWIHLWYGCHFSDIWYNSFMTILSILWHFIYQKSKLKVS